MKAKDTHWCNFFLIAPRPAIQNLAETNKKKLQSSVCFKRHFKWEMLLDGKHQIFPSIRWIKKKRKLALIPRLTTIAVYWIASVKVASFHSYTFSPPSRPLFSLDLLARVLFERACDGFRRSLHFFFFFSYWIEHVVYTIRVKENKRGGKGRLSPSVGAGTSDVRSGEGSNFSSFFFFIEGSAVLLSCSYPALLLLVCDVKGCSLLYIQQFRVMDGPFSFSYGLNVK